MAVVIGGATTASFNSKTNLCIASVNWSHNPNPERQYCIGSFLPSKTTYKPTDQMSFTIYASSGVTYATALSTACPDTTIPKIQASVAPVGCGASAATGLSGEDWYVTSYSFSKEDALMPGQETWQLTRWTNDHDAVVPDTVLLTMCEGEATDAAICGITFSGTTVTSYQGNVSAGASLGRADTKSTGIVSSVGGGSSAVGEIGSGSANITFTPIWY